MTPEDDLPLGYPAHWEADIVLRDGSVAHLRPIKPSDGDGIRLFHAGQSDESIYLRFFAPLRELSERDVYRFTHVDYIDRVALVVTAGEDIIGIGRYDRVEPRAAEVAFNISDHYHGRGIGSVLLEHLAAIAQEFGITQFTAEVLPQNRKMLAVFSDAGYAVTRRVEDGVVQVDFDIEPTDQSKAVALAREHRAEALSLRAVLTPTSVAVVGASRNPEAIGHRIVANLVAAGFTGQILPINPHTDTLLGLTAYPSVTAVPERVDLAVIAVPAAQVLEVVRECATAGVRALLVVSGGFAEVDDKAGGAGTVLQEELLRTARAAGMRVIGPNSFGIINNDPAVRLNATLAPTVPAPGGFGLFAQSGALGISLLASASSRRLGISSFASAGNRVDVSGNDFMQFWIDDEVTSAVGLYLESMGNPRKFSRVARHLASIKPVVVVKSAVTRYGAPPGHRVRKTQARPQVFDAMLRQAGVIRVDDVHQLFDVAQLLVHQPLPAGSRVAIVSNSTALAALAAEACSSWGLSVKHGPTTLLPEAPAADFRAALDDAFADPKVDSVLACFIPPVLTFDEDVARVVREAAAESNKPCLATFLGMRGVHEGHAVAGTGTGSTRGIPVYSTAEDAVRSLAAATRYGSWRAKDKGTVVHFGDINRRVAEDIVHTLLSVTPKGRQLGPDEAEALLAAYGIGCWPWARIGSVDEAVAAAERIGYPVVIKSVAPALRHGGGGVSAVRLDLRSEAMVRTAYAALEASLAEVEAADLVVQKMADHGVACVLTSDEDPLFGPVVGFSIAGLPTELLGDIAYRIPPLTDVDTHDLVTSIKAAPVLQGHRGATPVDLAALEELAGRLSVLADDLPEVASVRLNPVIAHPGGVSVLGAEIKVAPAPRRKDPGRRSLS